MHIFKYAVILFAAVILDISNSLAQSDKNYNSLIPHLQAFAEISSVTGREDAAAAYIRSLLPDADVKTDKLGNLILTIGSGSPKKLITAPLDEPGYVISQIQEDGYLRLAPIGFGHAGNLYHQFLQGHEVVITTEKGPLTGVSTVRSMHYERLRIILESSKTPFTWHEAFVDVGESSEKGVAQKNIKLLDPVTLNKKVSIINNTMMAAPAMKTKSAAIALAAVANSIREKDIKGTVVIAWTTLELINGKGLEAVINTHGPFDEIHRFNRFLESDNLAANTLLTNGRSFNSDVNYADVKPSIPFGNRASTVNFDELNVYEIGLPGLYEHTPVEMVAISDVEHLADYWLRVVGGKNKSNDLPAVKTEIPGATYRTFNDEHNVVSELVARYGVSSDEGQVREHILTQLPDWAKPDVDSEGNIRLSFGQGDEHIVFVAHMDETGYIVDSITDDGKLVLGTKGGMLQWLWEAQPALIHVSNQPIPGVFEPRKDYKTAEARALPSDLTVFAGFDSKSEALAAGIKIGSTTVTMPKKMIRLSENRAAARGFDDRVGSAALLMSLKDLNPAELDRRVTFVWSTAEEIGLTGSSYAAKDLTDADIVYPIDTYVSSDDPYTDETFANMPLGDGAVIRVLESINYVSRKNLRAVQDLAAKNAIKTQYGMTSGGTDGQAFLGYGIPSIPLSWPGRYSHSPVEAMDYRDMNNLVKLIQAIIHE
ncbi:M20/M25/M40 family metallo-hydrolase [Fulvivirga sedimenti]|uniref:M20/M25/M40 family metallo-hydrolase n=1 Tax=Fulvivirga sedimenti TaxID=2879465 RepID=A0A9X1HU47_9BACT|nr:M20/M25/M40 family metallo-hydrolase [Fulvivirga sedimenti]MCA6075030.1 M20/M25/M40 family metallo-hydrolase [Fulvivirga sedimenti]MCA6076207.1 M20/M25/M40 family metallo-hydrolase [Fulvivirga sedimenti]MCA6077335.1 M20/M25/M40 family metallo-hydrolase [Fulvivirga sedimenti]